MQNQERLSKVDALKNELAKIVKGQRDVIDQLVCAFVAGGHVLIEGVPGVAKTLLARTLSLLSGLEFNRIQFTSDLLPSDIIGTKVFLPNTGQFRFEAGPIFTDVLLADEINRTPPKTQAALLEAMEEGRITVEGETHQLSAYFFVIATQNPIEYEGTYPLPEAQTDRFMLKIIMGYPNTEDEIEMLRLHNSGFDPRLLAAQVVMPVLTASELVEIRQTVRSVKVEDGVLNYMMQIVQTTRSQPSVLLGASPRAAVMLLMASKAMAFMSGRDFVMPDDIKSIAPSVLRHRLILRPESELEGISAESVIDDILSRVQVPR